MYLLDSRLDSNHDSQQCGSGTGAAEKDYQYPTENAVYQCRAKSVGSSLRSKKTWSPAQNTTNSKNSCYGGKRKKMIEYTVTSFFFFIRSICLQRSFSYGGGLAVSVQRQILDHTVSFGYLRRECKYETLYRQHHLFVGGNDHINKEAAQTTSTCLQTNIEVLHTPTVNTGGRMDHTDLPASDSQHSNKHGQ